MVQIAILGSGSVAVARATAWQQVRCCRLVGVIGDPPQGEAGQTSLGPWFPAFAPLAASRRPDLLDVCQVPPARWDWLQAVAQCGCHVLVPAAFCLTRRDADSLRRAGPQHHVQVMIAQPWRFCSGLARVKETLDTGTLGEIRTARMVRTLDPWGQAEAVPPTSGAHNPGAALGGWFADADLAGWFLGPVAEVRAIAGEPQTRASRHVALVHAAGVQSELVVDDCPAPGRTPGLTLEVTGALARLEYHLEFRVHRDRAEISCQQLTIERGARRRDVPIPAADPLVTQLGYAVRALCRGEPWTEVSLAEARLALETALALCASAGSAPAVAPA